MSYHVEAPRFGFKELPDRILVREDGAYGASKEHGEPIIDHWYVPEQDAPQAALERRIDELCAEVEQGKAEFKKMDAWHSQELKAAMDENAKLREFIKLKQTCWKYAGWCHSCPYNGIDEDHADCNCTVQEEVEKMARELGIEGECAKS